MNKVEGELRLSASDVMRHQGCAHATTLDLRYLEVHDITPAEDSADAALLQRQGDDHELGYLKRLRDGGRSVIEIAKDELTLRQSVERTHEALRSGPDIIFQAAFLDMPWGGYSDFLERVDTPSALGPWSYEVVDTKLKRSPDPRHVLQLSLYSDLLAKIQGMEPVSAHLELGDGSRATIRLADVSSYTRLSRDRFLSFLSERPETRPDPVASCSLCRWREHCGAHWDQEDSLALVAGITRSQRSKIEAAGVETMAGLADLDRRVPLLAQPVQERLQTQARLQTNRRSGGAPEFVLREPEAGRGFALLPAPNEGDLFYDIEGDPYFPGGLEYLHGIWGRLDGEHSFKAYWAHDRDAEGRAVAELLAFFADHLRCHPRAHIYHYAQYELTALRRLSAFHRVGEAIMDQLQRERRFVDLYRVTSGALIASEPGYSIKNLETFYMEKREGDVATAGASVVFYERWRETGDPSLLAEIEAYNRTDCVSTELLRDWLVRSARPAHSPWPTLAPVAEETALTGVAEEEAAYAALYGRLDAARARLGIEAADLLLDLNFFHKREDKPGWWAVFDRLARESDDLVDDLECLTGLEAVEDPVQITKQSYSRTFSYPAQDTKLRVGSKPCIKPADAPDPVEIIAIDRDRRNVTLKRSYKKGDLPDRLDLIPAKPIANDVLRNAIGAVTASIAADDGRHRAIEQLLCRERPHFAGGARTQIVSAEGDLPDQISAAIAQMDETVVAIQGPPGTGKTYVSALSIVDLVRSGRRVAISSNAHKAIANLTKAVAERAERLGVPCRIARKASDASEAPEHPLVAIATENDDPAIAAADVVGATAWHFARYDEPAFDYLFVDEAGQVSLANIVAMARAARNLVLVGDPMQLPQPLQGAHPGRSGESALEYLMDGARVVAPDRGIFISFSRRMHPAVCSFVSAIAYEYKLSSDNGAALQSLVGTDGAALIGACFARVEHSGRSQVCPEEVNRVRDLINQLIGARFTDRGGQARLVDLEDILVVAPYNAQVNALSDALPAGARVGTVDRFQGQEAPICIVSMTTSSADELPRDIEFLFSLNRLNVAVSRAQVLAIVLASPALLEVPCRSVHEMTLVNALCLLSERQSPV